MCHSLTTAGLAATEPWHGGEDISRKVLHSHGSSGNNTGSSKPGDEIELVSSESGELGGCGPNPPTHQTAASPDPVASGYESCPRRPNVADGVWHWWGSDKTYTVIDRLPKPPVNTALPRSRRLPNLPTTQIIHALHISLHQERCRQMLTQGPHTVVDSRPSPSARGARDRPHIGATSRHMGDWVGVAGRQGSACTRDWLQPQHRYAVVQAAGKE
jgi:hypothetical protein